MKSSLLKLLSAALLITFTLSACKKNIRDLLSAMNKYGYSSATPLGKKTIAIDKSLLGGYAYQSCPVVITQKDAFTYNIKFLSITLDEPDEDVEGHLTILNGVTYLNINTGTRFMFLQVNTMVDHQTSMKMLSNAIKDDVPEANLKNWLSKNADTEYYLDSDSTKIYPYYEFVFNKITVEQAYQMQRTELETAKEKLFETCTDYESYNALQIKYPNDPLLSVARKKIYNNCKTPEEFEIFSRTFPDDPLAAVALQRAADLRMYQVDSTQYMRIRNAQDIEVFKDYIATCKTERYRKMAQADILSLANKISTDEIEWKWTSGDQAGAMKLMRYKLDYAQISNWNWYIEHLALFALKSDQVSTKNEILKYYDDIATKNPGNDDFLNLYLYRGMILWNLNKTEEALSIFQLKIAAVYSSGTGFKSMITTQHKGFKDKGVVFPNEKDVLKKIKKMK